MSAAVTLLKELVGLFFDDGRLAIAVLAILAGTGLMQLALPFSGPAIAALLVACVTGALVENVIRTAQAARAKD